MLGTTMATGAVLAICFNLFKPFLEVVVSPKAALHDPILRVVVLLLGAVVGLCSFFLDGAAVTAHALAMAALDGVKDGLGAVVIYHLVPWEMPSPLAPSPDPAPETKTSPVASVASVATSTPAPAVIVVPGAAMEPAATSEQESSGG